MVCPFCLSAGRSLAGDRTLSNRHLGTMGSIPRIISHYHIYNSDNNPGTNTDISPELIPPRTVGKSPVPPTGRSLISLGSYVIESAPPGDDSVPSPVQGSFHIFKNKTNRGRKPSSLGSTPPPTVWKPQFHWLESLIVVRAPQGSPTVVGG